MRDGGIAESGDVWSKEGGGFVEEGVEAGAPFLGVGGRSCGLESSWN